MAGHSHWAGISIKKEEQINENQKFFLRFQRNYGSSQDRRQGSKYEF
jgi:transcriptional/translational regulatory protein YebC/TACO1